MNDFVSELVRTYRESESPELFFYWAALSAISAIVKKNVWLNRGGHYKLYPNTYVFIVAESGAKKGIPIMVARKLVEAVNNTRMISGRNSIQEILDELGKAYSVEGGGIVKDAQAYLLSSELSVLLIKDQDAMRILTDIFDTHYYEKEYKYSLKSGKSVLSKPCISLFGATNEDHFSAIVSGPDIQGGFIARTFIVLSSDKGKPNPLLDDQIDIDLRPLIAKLKIISELRGEFKWTEEAKEFYRDWYMTFRSIDHNDPTHSTNRIDDQILKIAMCLGLSKGEFPELKLETIKEAIGRGLSTLNGAKTIVMGNGKSNLAAQTKLIIRALIQNPDHSLARKKLLIDGWGNFDAFDLDKIVETLNQAGAININRVGTNVVYSLRKEALDKYLEYKKSIN